jgi:hypothetical protein
VRSTVLSSSSSSSSSSLVVVVVVVVVVGRSQNTTHCVQFHYLYRRLWTLVVSITYSAATLRPYITLTFGGVAMACCFAQCQQRFKLSTCRSQIEISDILTLFNVQSKDRDCPSARCAAVSTAIRGNIQWLLPSEGIFSGRSVHLIKLITRTRSSLCRYCYFLCVSLFFIFHVLYLWLIFAFTLFISSCRPRNWH